MGKQSLAKRSVDDGRRDFLKLASLLGTGAAADLWLPAGVQNALAQAGERPIVETNAGKLRGSTSGNQVHAFLGVPYGAPTAGRRFKRATKPAPWSDVRDCLAFGPSAPTAGGTVEPGARGATGARGQSDDCLVLNVWTNTLKPEAKLPVMFWLHGGGYTTGSGSGYNGTNLAKRGDVVVVTINHRLGFLGYAHLPEIAGADYAESGNVGMLDCVLALEWVRDNIAKFGGDPNCVLIFGESGGGGKVSTLLTMPEAKGLFHRAAIQSGPGLRSTLPNAATRSAESFVKELGLTKANFADVQQMPLAKLKAAAASARGVRWAPVMDGKILPRHPFEPDASPLSAEIPILIGSNRTEQTYFERDNLDEIYAMDDAKLRSRLTASLGNDLDRTLKLYQQYFPSAKPGELYLYITTDNGMWVRSATLAERKVAQKRAPVFVYVFDWETNERMKSPHAAEISFVFDNVRAGGEAAQALAKKMSTAWATFAKTGDPNTADLKWNPYSIENRPTMFLGRNCHIENDPWKDARAIFQARARMPAT